VAARRGGSPAVHNPFAALNRLTIPLQAREGGELRSARCRRFVVPSESRSCKAV